MKTLLAAAMAVAMLALAFLAPAPAMAAASTPPTCTILSHPAGCVQPAPVWAHGTTGFHQFCHPKPENCFCRDD